MMMMLYLVAGVLVVLTISMIIEDAKMDALRTSRRSKERSK